MSNEEPRITMEALTDELIEFYAVSSMDRGVAGRAAIEWACAGDSAPFCIARREDRIVALNAYMQARIKLGPRTGKAFQSIDSFVAEEMRGKGMFTQLVRAHAGHTVKDGADLVWGFPNDNSAPAFFGKLGWVNHGQVPFMIKPLRAGYFLRKLKLFGDFPLSFKQDQDLQSIDSFDDWADELWCNFSSQIGCSIVRDSSFLQHRLFNGPNAGSYRVVAETSADGGLVATRQAEKHGGHIAYLMEAMGSDCVKDMLNSELARLRNRGVELVLAWCYPWSPNYRYLRDCGFMPLPERFRPTRIWFGGRASSDHGKFAEIKSNWYLSYLDSDTV